MADIWMDVDTAVTVFVNKQALIDDTDFKTREESVVYNQAGLDLVWNFITSAGVVTQTAVTPTDTAGDYDWTNVGNGMYKIEIPASGGASINNDTEGYGFFSGFATGILPWVSPTYGFRAAALNDALIDGGDNLDVNVVQWLGTACATPSVAGVPEVDLTHVAGATTNVSTLATNVNDILTDTAVIGAAGAGLTALASAASLATAQADLDILTGADGAIIASGTQTFNMTGNITGNLSGSIGSLDTQAKADVNAEVDAALNTAIPVTPTADSINERIQTMDGAYTAARAGYLDNINNAALATTAAQTGDAYARLGAPTGASVSADVASIKSDTAATLLDTGTDGVIVATNNDKTNYRLSATGVSDIGTAILTTALTESYAADGAAPTLTQAIFAIQQMMQEKSIASTIMTVKGLDGTTAVMTFTLDDATAPTSITRAT